jgi:hypothetical protein
MNIQSQSRKQTIRNLTIFAFIVIGIGWLGTGLDALMNNPPSQRLGMLLWLVAPLGASLLLRAFAGDGWKDLGIRPDLKGNGVWYGVGLLLDRAIIATYTTMS